MALVISFVLELKGLAEGFMVMSFLYYYDTTEVCRQMGFIHGEKSAGVGSDGMIEVAYNYVMFG